MKPAPHSRGVIWTRLQSAWRKRHAYKPKELPGLLASAFKGKNPTKEEVERIAAEAFIRNMEKCKIRVEV